MTTPSLVGDTKQWVDQATAALTNVAKALLGAEPGARSQHFIDILAPAISKVLSTEFKTGKGATRRAKLVVRTRIMLTNVQTRVWKLTCVSNTRAQMRRGRRGSWSEAMWTVASILCILVRKGGGAIFAARVNDRLPIAYASSFIVSGHYNAIRQAKV